MQGRLPGGVTMSGRVRRLSRCQPDEGNVYGLESVFCLGVKVCCCVSGTEAGEQSEG